ncbi:MAG: hypothetical protein MJ136_06470 [Clostridia bacterium]|nr:hypothetical protein [Clostridia bacterium]
MLSTQAQGDMIFVTFNSALTAADSGGEKNSDALLRRRLAMAAVTAALTEDGRFTSVQVLVKNESRTGVTMRLTGEYDESGDTTPLPPYRRDESFLLTPRSALCSLLEGWKTRNLDVVRLYTTGDALTEDTFAQAARLTDYEVSSGSVSPDGAVVLCVTLTMPDNAGREETKERLPARMTVKNGVWYLETQTLLGWIQVQE